MFKLTKLSAASLSIIFILFSFCSCADGASGQVSSDSRSIDFKYEKNSDYAIITRYNGTGGNVEIPSELDGLPVQEIGDSAFENCDTVTSVTMPDSIEKIGERAFYNCYSLADIHVPDSVKECGSFAFKNTTWYENNLDDFVIIGDGVLVAYKGKSNNVDVPVGVKKIGDAFYDSFNIVSINIPSTVEEISDGAFYACTLMKSIEVQNNDFYTVSDNVLYTSDMTRLLYCPPQSGGESLIVNEATIEIAPYAFANNSKLESIVLHKAITSIGSFAFDYCSELEDIEIPDSVKYIGDSAFNQCTSLKKVKLSNSLEKIAAGTFSGCRDLEQINIPISVRIIEEKAFYYCTSLENVEVPETTSVAENAFDK
ncbi:MAG: leucine-rich repeat domain-containing protein [Clostridia bacterium]|nr:leucine-rich repeat domain-containing protein [Clostridia bacterium]